jgi:ATP-binding cassette subfamily B protein
MKISPPQFIRDQLSSFNIDFERDVLLALPTDINEAGKAEAQWLLCTRQKLYVFDVARGIAPIFSIDLARVDEFRLMPAVGSGILQIRSADSYFDLLRFSNRLKFRFEQILKVLNRILRKEILPDNLRFEAHDPQRCKKCGLMLEFPGEPCPRCLRRGTALWRIFRMMAPYRRAIFILSGLLLIGLVLDMAWPLLTQRLVDNVLVPGSDNQSFQIFSWLAHESPERQLLYIVLALAGVQILRSVINHFASKSSAHIGNALTFDIRGRLVKKLEELGLAYYNKQETGSLVGRVAYDTEGIQGFVGQFSSGFFMQLLLVFFSFVMMMSLDSTLALCAVIPAPMIIGGAFIYWRYVHPHYQRLWDRTSKQAGLLSGLLSGIRVVKAFGREETEFHKFQKSSREVRRSQNRVATTASYFQPFMAVVFQAGGWIIWYAGGRGVLEGKISLGTLMAFFGYLSMFYGPLGSLTNLTTWVTQFSTQMHRIFEILDTPTVLPQPVEAISLKHPSGHIEFKDVTFGYTRGIPVIRDFNLFIKAGQRIGIVGRSGAGKTSLVNLLLRFYDVDSGSISIDGIDLRLLSKEDLHAAMSVVLQEAFLFRGTLAENIAYGAPDSNLESILQAGHAASAHGFIIQHPMAYDTSVGELGQELSGGERQRISIARALLVRAPILILDEATSAIDSESELAIQSALEDISKSRTTLIIAHRLSTIKNCDRIVFIDSGHITESGSHDELMAQNGTYAAWVRIQRGQTNGAIKDNRLAKHADFGLHWIDPGTYRFQQGLRNELSFALGNIWYRSVFALRCFPVLHPSKYISIRAMNGDGRIVEYGIIRDLAEWDEETQRLVNASLARRYFFHTVTDIEAIRKFSQFLAITAKTDLGTVDFILRYQPDSAPEFGKTGRMLMDVEDNLYVIPDVNQLSDHAKSILNRYVYW